ncbi:rhodanese-like domain-containing protein, partial [Akkermansiaceae bacterium]|nr:rhodanese-like domain-containing protein [Akkermansiaceae bacterium]
MIRSLFACALLSIAPSFAEEIKDVTPAEAQARLKEEKPPVIIDIRTPAEFKKGHLKGAKNINYREDFEDNLAKLDPSKRYI